jgi:DNA-binding IclR family transcriptional regulator
MPMRDLSDAVRESCHLSILHGDHLLVIAQAESPEPVRLSIEVGDRVSVLDTASGCLLLAFLSAEERESFLRSDKRYAAMTRAERKALSAQLPKILAKGYYMAYSTRRTGIDISCLVGNPRVSVAAALGVPILPGGRNDGRERKLVPIVRKHANRITALLGLARR